MSNIEEDIKRLTEMKTDLKYIQENMKTLK